MTREQWVKVKELYADALELEPAARESFVREAAGVDTALLSELLRLLKEDECDSGLLSGPAIPDSGGLVQEDKPRFAPSSYVARRFRIVRFIARGGMGDVYEAEDLELGERVALKAIRLRAAADVELRALFKREILLARRVTHPNVCRIFDLAVHEDPGDGEPALLLSMELIEGQTLTEYVRRNGPMRLQDAIPLIVEIASGLQAVHDAGIVHGDLKPGNVMLVSQPGETAMHARVMDFGMALPVIAGPPDPQERILPRGGTPDYLAPEQVGGGPATVASDVYALALVIAQMLGVRLAKSRELDAERIPASWARVLRRCLDKDPSRRYARPAEVWEALRASAGGRSKAAWIAVVTAAAVLAIAIAATRSELARGTTNTLILTETRDESMDRPSPDGRLLAGTSWDTGDLILRDVKSNQVRRLTHKTTSWNDQFGGAYDAIFSPDGRRIVYVWMNSRSDSELRLIGSDGAGDRTLYHVPDAEPRLLDWSPDGGRLLFEVIEHGQARYAATLLFKDASVQPIARLPAGANAMFGADENSFLFDKAGEIHRLFANGMESTLVSHPGKNHAIGWERDRRRLIFFSDRRGPVGIWAVSVTGNGAEGEPQELVQNATKWEPLAITGTGSLLYRQNADLIDIYTAVLDIAAGKTVSPPRRVTEQYIGSYSHPKWSEDGRQLVFNSQRDPAIPRIGIWEARTGRMREVPVDLAFSWRPQWTEHGAAVVAPGRSRDGQEGLFRIDPNTGAAKLSLSKEDLESTFEGVWSPDGKIHFNRYNDFRRGLFRLNVATGERRLLYVPPPGVDLGTENLTLSPDGSTLAFHARQNGRGTLMLMPAEGGEARPLLTLKSPQVFWYGSFAWTPDSRQVVAVVTNVGQSPKQDLTSEIWSVPVDGSHPAKVDFPRLWVTSLGINPDGKTIAFQVRSWRSEIWALQDFLSRRTPR